MLSITDYLLASSLSGGSAAQKATDNLWNAVHGRHEVTVDQSYIDSLHAHLQTAQTRADRNYQIGNDWIALAERLEQENAQLKSKVAALNRVTAERNGLLKFLDMAVHLLQSQREGKTSRPEFAQLREFALEVAGIHLDGGVYEGLADQPEKMAWLEKLWEALR